MTKKSIELRAKLDINSEKDKDVNRITYGDYDINLNNDNKNNNNNENELIFLEKNTMSDE